MEDLKCQAKFSAGCISVLLFNEFALTEELTLSFHNHGDVMAATISKDGAIYDQTLLWLDDNAQGHGRSLLDLPDRIDALLTISRKAIRPVRGFKKLERTKGASSRDH